MAKNPIKQTQIQAAQAVRALNVVAVTGIIIVVSLLLMSLFFAFRPFSSQRVLGSAVTYHASHVPIPDEVRGIYWTAFTAGSQKRSGELIEYMATSGLNTAVIDLKMDDGEIAFTPNDRSLVPYAQDQPAIKDLDGLLRVLEERGIYRIARIAVMRDGAFAHNNHHLALKTPSGAYWRDSIGSVWVDPAAPVVAEYSISLALEAYERGFDEVQFDYVRFPSDGSVNRIAYPIYNAETQTRTGVMQHYFERVGGTMQAYQIPVSFDVFGMTFWSKSDYNIGQRLIDVYPYADYVSPMVYPSHYPNNFRGLANPAEHPYTIVYRSLEEGVLQLETELAVTSDQSEPHVRPWLQDFDIGAVYTSDLIEAQIKAARDAGASGWILWNARNVYEPANYR